MGLTTTLTGALTGLTASSRAAEIVSSNIANATTDGYAVRELVLTSRTTGSGVQVVGVQRATDPALTAERRGAEAAAGGSSLRADFLTGLEDALGAAEDEGGLTAKIAAFDAALVSAAASPESDAQLATVASTAKSVVAALNSASDTVQTARQEADSSIASQVDRLNTALDQVADLNARIVRLSAQGRDTSALMDQRQQVIDSVSDIVPLREVARDDGQVTLYTKGGALLVDGARASDLGFQATGTITPDMTLASGALSGLTLNGKAVSAAESGSFGGGTLSAAFSVRDDLAPDAQAQLDAVARDLMERFADIDPTLATGEAGLFTDGGLAFSATAETGLAQRLSLNAAVDTGQGGALWRLRDGLGAATSGASGDGSLLTAMDQALTESRATASGSLIPASRSFSGLAADLLSSVASDRLAAESSASHAAARAEVLQSEEAAKGVDTDVELQNLLLIEQAYAANAKVIQTVDAMIQTLLEI
ncbi:MAG: flagellar hook-associated protein FlgK [Paracoccaceae bacterium]